MEAMAMGLPVLTTKNSGSVIRDEKDGFIVGHNVDEIVSRLEQLSMDPALHEFMSRNSREQAELFSLARYGDQLGEIYTRTLVNQKRESTL